jgi:phage tail protein X
VLPGSPGLRCVFVRSLLVGIAASLALCACGAPMAGIGPANPAPGRGFDVSVTEKDRAVSLRVGQKLEAVLHANPGMTAWSEVKSTDPTILASIVDTGATAVRGVTLAGFQAVAPGHAQITAYAGMDCSPGQPCAMFLLVLTIDVTVTPG